ncbi:hypothetical protein [Nocardia sp. NPDC005998]|uniref:hypothetical protein n=1 Tax=Nocardia sp. NPDC005998 TaxID=3156894 RepID=UPI0033BB169C
MNHRSRIIVASAMTATLMTLTAEVATAAPAPTTLTAAETEPAILSADTWSSAMPSTLPVTQDQMIADQTNTTAVQPLSPSLRGSTPVAAVDGANPQADIDNALSQAGNEFMLAVTVGTMAGGVVGLVGGCVVGAVVGAIGGCIPGLGIGAAVGPIIGGLVVGVPVGIAALAQAYNTLHAAGDISAPVATQIG